MTTGSGTVASPVTFSLPEYERAGREFFFGAVRELMRSIDPVLGMMRIETVDELPNTRVTVASNQVVDMAPMVAESHFSISRSETLAGRFDGLYAALVEAAESGLASMMPQFFAQISEICDAAGQTVDAKGQAFSYDLLVEVLDGMEFTFDEDGTPQLSTLVMHPDMAERIRNLPQPTREQQQTFEAMIDRKRSEFVARRRNRRLPRQPG